MKQSPEVKPIPSLHLENLTFSYPNHPPILEKTSVFFPKDQIIHITGSSGSGKTTLLRILAALLTPTEGKYFIGNTDVAQLSFEEFLPYRLNIGYGFDYGGLLSNRTLIENVLLPLQYHKRVDLTEAMMRAEKLMREFCIWSNKDLRPSSVSGSQRKACCVARAFITYPEVLILDQPTTGLDGVATTAFLKNIESGRKEGWLKHLIITSNDSLVLDRLGGETFVVFEKKIYSYSDFEKKVVYA